ncbi:MAG TPA: glycerol-3-phosphate 1-O-acyltransferase PlsY [Burkholderiales bacterium]|nr:glycerol-3-phosphate 1-O-acyltransferase PlsY [Burkholderiales bacterium]
MTPIALTLLAYLLGSIPFAVIVSRAFALPDPRSYGSGNPGATNVLRTGKKAAAALTLLGDGLKGWLAVFLAQRLAEAGTIDVTVAAAAVAATLGHMYPVFLRLRGGKGVATTTGVLLALDAWLAAGTIATWLIIAFFFRYSSLAALVAAAFAPFFAFFLYGMERFAWEGAIGVAVIAALIAWRHQSNIRNLIAGTEGRIGGGSSTPQS